MQIQMTVTKKQLDVLLSQIEGLLCTELHCNEGHPTSLKRGPDLARAALKLPANTGSYDIAHLAPTYLQLVAAWKDQDTEPACVEAPDWQRAWGRRRQLEVCHE